MWNARFKISNLIQVLSICSISSVLRFNCRLLFFSLVFLFHLQFAWIECAIYYSTMCHVSYFLCFERKNYWKQFHQLIFGYVFNEGIFQKRQHRKFWTKYSPNFSHWIRVKFAVHLICCRSFWIHYKATSYGWQISSISGTPITIPVGMWFVPNTCESFVNLLEALF